MGHRSKHRHHHRTKPEDMESLYSTPDAPISPLTSEDWGKKINAKGKNDPKYKAYQFYQRIRELLPEWWEEFNGELDKYSRLKYTTIRVFILSKTKNASEKTWLYQMLGPARKRDDQTLPWFGDWEKRRNNGFGMLDEPSKLKPLIKVIRENLAAVESIKALSPFLLEDLVQFSNLEKQVHQAFAGRAFLKDKEANDKRNIARFDTYKTMLAACAALKTRVIKDLMRIHGFDPETPQQMRDVAQIAGGIGAAAALTGIAAGQSIPGLGQGIQTPSGTQIAPYTYDALKLAENLTKHAHTFKKPLPVTLEADPSSFDQEEKPKHKGNGKTQ